MRSRSTPRGQVGRSWAACTPRGRAGARSTRIADELKALERRRVAGGERASDPRQRGDRRGPAPAAAPAAEREPGPALRRAGDDKLSRPAQAAGLDFEAALRVVPAGVRFAAVARLAAGLEGFTAATSCSRSFWRILFVLTTSRWSTLRPLARSL